VVVDAEGAPVMDVRVEMDGKPLISRIDGRGLRVNPGLHEFAFSTDAGVFHTEKVLVTTGQRNQRISAQWAPPAAGPSPPAAPPAAAEPSPAPPAPAPAAAPMAAHSTGGGSPSTVTYVVAGAGVATIGTSLLFAVWGSNDNERLNRCAPNCSADSVEHVKNLYIASDVTMGVGVVALGVATWFLVSDLTAPSDADTGTGLRIDVQPLASGAQATLRGAF
jgi:hypothetical protein